MMDSTKPGGFPGAWPVIGRYRMELEIATEGGQSLPLNAEAVFTALFAWFAFRENVDRRIALGMAAIVAGAIVLNWPRGALHASLAHAGGAGCRRVQRSRIVTTMRR